MKLFYTASVQLGKDANVGYAVNIHNVVSHLRARGHKVQLFACEGDPPITGDIDPDFESISSLPKTFLSLIRFNLRYYSRLKYHYQKNKPDLLYMRLGIWQFAPVYFAKRYGLPWVLEINGIPDMDQSINPLHDRLIGWMIRNADRVITKAPFMGEHFSNRYGISRDKFKVVVNGVDVKIYQPLELNEKRKLIPEDRIAVGFVGLLAEYSGIERLWKSALELTKLIPDIVFLVVGEGDLKETLRKEFKRKGLENHLLLTSSVPYEEAARWMAECDLLVAPYLPIPRNETLSPVKVYHYLATGVPTLASNLEIMKQFDGSGLELYPAEDQAEFVKSVCHLLRLSPEEKSANSKKSREFIIKNFTWKKTVDQIEQEIKLLLE